MMSDQTPEGNSNPSTSLPRGLLSRRGKLTPNARLPSLRPQRDLTLGGVQKKTFKPNIPSRKERNKDASSEANNDSSSKEQSGKRDQKKRREKRERARHEAVQSHSSIFEEGPAAAQMKRWGGGGGGGGGDGGGSSGGFSQRRILKKERDPESEAKVMQELMKDDFIDDFGDKAENSSYSPIFLPLKGKKRTVKKEVKTEKEEVQDMEIDIEIKEEKHDSEYDDAMEGVETSVAKPERKAKEKIAVDQEKVKAVTASSLFSNTKQREGELLFFQLPDSLPGSAESEISKVHIKKEGQVKQNQSEEEQNPQDSNCHLKHLPEGFIGKLQVLKSGRTRLLLGNVSLDVSMGAPCGFLQDVVSTHINEDKTGNMNNLGQVRHRIVCSPDFENLLSFGT